MKLSESQITSDPRESTGPGPGVDVGIGWTEVGVGAGSDNEKQTACAVTASGLHRFLVGKWGSLEEICKLIMTTHQWFFIYVRGMYSSSRGIIVLKIELGYHVGYYKPVSCISRCGNTAGAKSLGWTYSSCTLIGNADHVWARVAWVNTIRVAAALNVY